MSREEPLTDEEATKKGLPVVPGKTWFRVIPTTRREKLWAHREVIALWALVLLLVGAALLVALTRNP